MDGPAMSFLGPLAFADSPIQNLSIFDPASPPAASIRDLTFLVFAITGFIFVVVEGVLIYTLIRFRRSRNAGSEPPQVYGSKPIEIAWTAAPALIVFILILVTTRTLWEVEIITPKPKAGDGALFVTVTGRQWWWQYTYDHYDGKELGFTTANELHVPFSPAGVAKPIYLILESADVCHSFWVPRLAGKTDLLPGRTNHMWFQPDQPGLFVGQCAEYCGTQHANMLLRVVVEPQEDFERWLAGEQKPAVENPNLLEDKAAFFAQTCVNCHRIRGTPAAGAFGPDLTHLRSRATLASGMIPNTAENLRRWIDDPQKIKPGCLMPAFGLSDGDRDRIVAYLQSLR
jgi:cytochrome c oxidase subunit 2